MKRQNSQRQQCRVVRLVSDPALDVEVVISARQLFN
jgi:hypothetical protein